MDLREEDILGEKANEHWYYKTKGEALYKLLRNHHSKKVLDVGAGSGIFSKQLLAKGICDEAVCVDPNYSKEEHYFHEGKRIDFVRSTDREEYGLILMMDVLEHVENDFELVDSYMKNLSDHGHLVITVPAFQFLWSDHDVFLQHYRRYTIASLKSIIQKAGLTPVQCSYFFSALFPFIAISRLARNFIRGKRKGNEKSQMKLHSRWMNKLLCKIHRFEKKLVFPTNKLFGLSVFMLCSKSEVELGKQVLNTDLAISHSTAFRDSKPLR